MKALLLAARNPWPPLRGDQMRARDFIEGLTAMGASVELLSLGDPAGAAVEAPPTATGHAGSNLVARRFQPTWWDRVAGLIGWIGGLPLQSVPFACRRRDAAAVERVRQLGAGDVLVLQLARQLPLLRRLTAELADRPAAQRPLVVVDLIDTLSLNFSERARLDSVWTRPLWTLEARRLRQAERTTCALADRVVVVCDRDLAELVRFAPAAEDKGSVLRLPVALPTEEAAAPTATAGGPARSPQLGQAQAASTVALTGNLGYFVNDLAARRFAGEVWPLIRAEAPDARLVVAGARPSAALKRLMADLGETLIADPGDLRAVLRDATVAVAPLSGGAGVPVKVLEAWAERVPMVASEWAAAGVAREPGEDVPLVSVPDDAAPDLWASAVVPLLADADQRNRLTTTGTERLESLHSQAAFQRGLSRLLARESD